MVDINLLPWREKQRDQCRKQYFIQLGLIAVLAIVIVISVNSVIGQYVSSQNMRNAVLTDEIQQMSQTNTKMKNVNQERDQLVVQLKKLQQLHNSRFQLVSLFNGLVHILPDGVHLTQIKRTEGEITLQGIANNHEEVSVLLRNIHNSKWFTELELSQVADGTSSANKEFRVTMHQQNYGEKNEF